MAYCRCDGSSDVYMYHTFNDEFFFSICKDNSLGKEPISFTVKTPEEALHRLQRMKVQGFKIDEDAIKRLEKEIGLDKKD